MKHLAIRAPNWVGDLVMATPILRAALADERFGRVSVVVRSHLREVLSGGVIEGCSIGVGDGRSERRVLEELSPNAILLLSNSFGAAWRAWQAGIPVRAGAALSARRVLLTHAVLPPARAGRRVPIPTAHLLRDVAGLLGIRVPDLHPRLDCDAATRIRAAERLRQQGLDPQAPYVLCCPGAAFGAAKLWPAQHFARVLDQLFESRGWRGVVTGGPGEEELVRSVASATRTGAAALLGDRDGLGLLKAWVRGARLLLVGDSGPRWYAAAFDVPCVSVMGPNFPELTASSLELCEVARVEELECSPCLERVCPLGHHRCMRELAPASVLRAVDRVLARGSKLRAEVPA